MDLTSWIFFGPAKIVDAWQYAGIAIALALIGVQAWFSWRKRELAGADFFREAPVFAGLLWVIFNLYELQVAAIYTQGAAAGNALRMDLIILVPILYAMTFAALLSIRAQWRNLGANK
jgi:hypothetical protein